MRDILFRGKRLDNCEWVEGFYSFVNWYDPKTKEMLYVTHSILPVGAQDSYRIYPATVGQFTGFLDKNGKKIFEGDVLKIFYCPSGFEIGKVKWAYEKCRFVIVLQGDGFSYNFDDTLDCYIIGNIHDNPELLQEAKDASFRN